MEWEILYHPDDNIVLVTAWGIMTLESLKAMSMATFAEAVARSCHKVLADHRRITHQIEVVDIYRLPDMFRQWGWTGNYSVATVFAPQTGQGADFTFFDNRAYNTGLRHQLFTDIVAARDWLLEQP